MKKERKKERKIVSEQIKSKRKEVTLLRVKYRALKEIPLKRT